MAGLSWYDDGGTWTARVCRSRPDAREAADLLRAMGAEVSWCGPDCCSEETPVSVNDPGDDLSLPATERRGGEHPDWEHAEPGKELPELPDDLPDHDEGGEG